MNPRDQNDLLKEILGDDALAAVRADSLASGLAALRRRRRIRLAAQAAVLCVPVLFALGWWWRSTPEGRTEPLATLPREANPAPAQPLYSIIPPLPATAAVAAAPISDEQLLALFPGRTVALIGPPGHQKFLVFDGP